MNFWKKLSFESVSNTVSRFWNFRNISKVKNTSIIIKEKFQHKKTIQKSCNPWKTIKKSGLVKLEKTKPK